MLLFVLHNQQGCISGNASYRSDFPARVPSLHCSVNRQIRQLTSMDEAELYSYAKNIQVR